MKIKDLVERISSFRDSVDILQNVKVTPLQPSVNVKDLLRSNQRNYQNRGIYIYFRDDNKEVIYVGKANKNDFGNRIYSHMKKNHKNWDTMENGFIFPDADIAASTNDQQTADLIRRGCFSMQFIELSSLEYIDRFV